MDPSSSAPSSGVEREQANIESAAFTPSGSDSAITTRIPRPSTLPRKGILKRSGSAHATTKREYFSPQPGHKSEWENSDSYRSYSSKPGGRSRRALLSTASAGDEAVSTPIGGSKIPKLSVTWWETNSVCGEAPQSSKYNKQLSPPPLPEERDRGSDEENDDVESVQSGGSSLAGNWWFGRTTRYVPHCERRHLHLDESGQYLTPTQRKNKEIADLKKELKRSQKAIDDKEDHLRQLRDRLGELERVMDQGGYLTENKRLQTKMNTITEEFRHEKRLIMDHYDEKFKRLKAAYDRDSLERETTFQFELDELRSSLERERSERTVEDGDSGLSNSGLGMNVVNSAEACTMTDPQQPENSQEIQAYQYECLLLRNRVSELEFTLTRCEKDLASEEPCGSKTCGTKQRAQAAQLEACKNECLVWRTKASEMEIALKQEMASKNAMRSQIQSLEQAVRQANERQHDYRSRLRSFSSLSSLTKCSLDDVRGSDDTVKELDLDAASEEHKKYALQMRTKVKQLEKKLESTKKQLRATVGHLKGPCSKEHCMNERKRLMAENEILHKENKELAEGSDSMSRELDETKRVASERAEMMKTSEQVIQNMEHQLNAKRTELEVAQLTLQKLKEENEKMNSEVQELNGQLGNLESIMADCGIVVATPNSSASLRRKSMRSGQQQAVQVVYRARQVQTDLSWTEEVKMENELRDLLESNAILQAKYDEEKSDLEMKLDEISQNLHLKNNLVGTLTNQIHMLNDEYESARSGFERERLQYSQKLHDLDLIAQRVPFLEHDVATAREEVQMVESSYEKEKGRFERTMEDSLAETMKSQWQTAEYWKAKLEESIKRTELYKRRCEQAEKELNDVKMRTSLEKVELQQKMQDLCGDLSQLQTKVFANRRHQSVQTFVQSVDKAVLCYVKCDTKSTEISEGDLIDEREERMKMLQGELLATRRQVEVLQGKLFVGENVSQQLDDAEGHRRELENTIARQNEEIKVIREDLRVQNEEIALEKERMELEEQKRIAELETAFEQVRQELDSIITRYEEEKREMLAMIEEKCTELEQATIAKYQMEKNVARMWRTVEEHASRCAGLKKEMEENGLESMDLDRTVIPSVFVQLAENDVGTAANAENIPNEDTDGPITLPDADQPISHAEETNLDDVRVQLAHIAHQFEALADERNGERMEKGDAIANSFKERQEMRDEGGREKMEKEMEMEKKLETDAENEKDTTIKRYEEEKRKLEDKVEELRMQLQSEQDKWGIIDMESKMEEAKEQLQSEQDKCRIAQMELEYVLLELHDTKQELEMAKANASFRPDKTNDSEGRKWKSQTDLSCIDTKVHRTDSPRDHVQIQWKYSILTKENDQLQRELNLLRIDNALMELELKKKKDSTVSLTSQEKIESKEFADLKSQLRQAEYCAHRLETEATQWRNELASMKGRKSRRTENGDSTSKDLQPGMGIIDGPKGETDGTKDSKLEGLIGAKLDLELAESKRECADLKKQLSATISKHSIIMRRQREEIDRLRERHENEMKAVQQILIQLQSSARPTASPTLGSERMVTLRRCLDNTTAILIEKSKELEKLECEVIYLKARLAEVNAKDALGEGSSKDDFSPSSFALFLENLKVKHDIEMKALRQELLEEREQRYAGSSGEEGVAGSSNGVHDRFGSAEPDCSAFNEALDDCNLSNSHADILRGFYADALSRSENAKRRALECEQKVVELEKELKMVNEELHLTSINYAERFTSLRAENADLRAQLIDKANSRSIEDIDNNNYAKMETAVNAARAMQERLEQVTTEMEEREKHHQEIYLIMFRKGQEAAKMEMSIMEGDTAGGSTSSSEWSYGRTVATIEDKTDGEKDQDASTGDLEKTQEECVSKKHSSGGLTKEEIILHFLRDAVYYYLVNRDPKDHLQAIMSILNFSERQRRDVAKAKGLG